MDRLVDGDRSAFDPLFEVLYPLALRVARRRLDDTHAEDAAQRTMTAVFARAIEFTRGRAVLPWFYTIAANETHAIARRLRVAASREAPAAAADLVAGDDNPEHAVSLAEMRFLLQEAVLGLDPVSAAAIEAQLTEDAHSGPRSAAMRKRISRAYARLRSLLEDTLRKGAS